MVSIPEIITWVIGVSVAVFGISQYRYLRRIPHHRYLVFSYFSMLLAWSFTILEGFFWEDVLNTLEHTFLLTSVVIITGWFYHVTLGVGKDA